MLNFRFAPIQASSQSMPWLADLVQSSEGSLDVLPVQCLCEFLLHDAADDASSIDDEEEGESKEQRVKKRQVKLSPDLTFLLSSQGVTYHFFPPEVIL